MRRDKAENRRALAKSRLLGTAALSQRRRLKDERRLKAMAHKKRRENAGGTSIRDEQTTSSKVA